MSTQTHTQRKDAAKHGTRAKYVGGCRCGPCRSANSDYEFARRNPDQDAIARLDHHVQLVVDGWPRLTDEQRERLALLLRPGGSHAAAT